MAELFERERISLLTMPGWGDQRRYYKRLMRLFNETFRHENSRTSKSTVGCTIQRFEKTGSVINRSKSGWPPTVTNDDKALDVLLSYVEDPNTSINRVSQQHSVGAASVHTILKKNKWHQYKIHLVQELSDDDFDRRVEFCDLMMELIVDDPLFLVDLLFPMKQLLNWMETLTDTIVDTGVMKDSSLHERRSYTASTKLNM